MNEKQVLVDIGGMFDEETAKDIYYPKNKNTVKYPSSRIRAPLYSYNKK